MPFKTRIKWGLLYLAVFCIFMSGLYIAANKIKTHTLPVGQIELTVPYSQYLVGEVVSFSLKNNYNSPVYITNNCPSEPLAVYRLEEGVWKRQHETTSKNNCPNQERQVSIPANGVVHGTFEPWRNLFSKPGKYRVVAFVEFYNYLPFQDFEIITPPAKFVAQKTSSTSSQGTQKTQTPSSSTPSQAPTAPSNSQPYTEKKSKTVSVSQGSISVQYDSTTIYVVSIAPASGCRYEGGRSGRTVQVTFKCGEKETQITLSIVNGNLVQKVENDH